MTLTATRKLIEAAEEAHGADPRWTGPAMQSQVDRQIAAIAAYLALQRFQGEMGHAKATDAPQGSAGAEKEDSNATPFPEKRG